MIRRTNSIASAPAVPFLVLFSFLNAGAQLRIVVAGDVHKAGEPITVKLMNDGKKPIVFCRSFCGSLVVDTKWGVPAFDVMRGRSKSSLLWGCDVGWIDVPDALGPGESAQFQLKLAAPGKYRLLLKYVVGEQPDSVFHKKCEELEIWKKAKLARSRPFVVNGDG